MLDLLRLLVFQVGGEVSLTELGGQLGLDYKTVNIGALWENFLFMERLKLRSYRGISANQNFWRTWERKEIDPIEEREGRLFAYEFKWSDKKVRVPKAFIEAYPDSGFECITRDNYLPFVT